MFHRHFSGSNRGAALLSTTLELESDLRWGWTFGLGWQIFDSDPAVITCAPECQWECTMSMGQSL